MTTIKPWKIGEEATYVLGVRGVLEAREKDSVTIAGHTLPTTIGSGVIYASIDLPPETERCKRDHCDDADCEASHDDCCQHGDLDGLLVLIEAEHDAQMHRGAFRFCRETLCAASQGVRSGA